MEVMLKHFQSHQLIKSTSSTLKPAVFNAWPTRLFFFFYIFPLQKAFWTKRNMVQTQTKSEDDGWIDRQAQKYRKTRSICTDLYIMRSRQSTEHGEVPHIQKQSCRDCARSSRKRECPVDGLAGRGRKLAWQTEWKTSVSSPLGNALIPPPFIFPVAFC